MNNIDISKINTYNKDLLVKDFLIGKVGLAINKTLSDSGKEQFILKGGSALRKFFIANYPRFTGDLDYKFNNDISDVNKYFRESLLDNINVYLEESISDSYKSVNIGDIYETQKGIIQTNIRFGKVLGRFDYTIGLDLSPKANNEYIKTQELKILPSKIDEITGYNSDLEFTIEDINYSMGNKLFACLHRIGSSNYCGSILSRLKDVFDIRYCYKSNLLDIDQIKLSFAQRYNSESALYKKIVLNQLHNILDNDKYMQNLIVFLLKYENLFDEKNIFYKYTKGLDKNYIIPNLKDIYDTFRKICIEVENGL